MLNDPLLDALSEWDTQEKKSAPKKKNLAKPSRKKTPPKKKTEQKQEPEEPKKKQPTVPPGEDLGDILDKLGDSGSNFPGDPDDMAELIEQSTKAKLMEPILKNEAQAFKNETAKLQLLEKSGNVMQTELGDFLFLSHIEKADNDLCKMMKRLEPLIDNLVKEQDTRGVIKMVTNEIDSILRNVRKNQAKDVKAWKRELKGR